MIKTIRSLMFAIVLGFSMVMTQSVPVYAAGTDLTITKTIEGGITTAQVGDIIRYRIHFACSNLTTPCGPMEITDVLQAGLTYIPAQSSVPAGFTMTESPVGTIKITKDDNNLLDGSQYDAVIAVQVNYDLRPLPATINNTVTGRIAPTGLPNWENTTPASAPPVTVNGVAPNWQITKSLSSPLIEPTVDTDVTYQIQLCPITPAPYPAPGNVSLSNIVITDTLPTGAVFVSASNGGVYAPGPETVTWSFAGPVYPPNCVTRFVTIRYNSPSGTPPGPFAVGNNVINTVDYDADYVPSTGTCTTPCTSGNNDIQHSLDQIFEVPTYSKDDIGDPIGFSGTGRFTLNLDTNNTNYPSNNLILVDTLPPQLRVTGVTSGEWDATFDYVRAHVEYSTNYGNNYIAFTGSPVLYNTNAIFSTGLPANITNVRWRFEYDPDKTAPFNYTQAGLPYTWAFTNSPEIRVSPRAAATTADPPSGAAMPAAIAGNTYTNCVQTTRTNSSGTPVSDPCNNETMTVQGNLVSLRVSKNETPGGTWNDLDDPTILTFSPDTKILPGDTLRYTITIELTERSSENLVNPTIQDVLPVDTASPVGPDFVFVRNGTATLDGGAVVQPIFTQVGQTLKWEWPSLTVTPLLLGSRYLTVEFYGYVPRGQDPGTYTNNLYALTDSTAVVCEIAGTQLADSGDMDTDGNTAEFGCNNPDPYVVERSAALRGEKWIRSISPDNNQVVLASTFLPDASCPSGGTVGLTSIPTNPFTRYPCIAQAFPEGALSPNQFAPPPSDTTIDDFEYNLRIFNDGNVPMLEYVLYDILPRVGDTGSGGVLANTARASEFRPGLTGPIQFIQGPGGLTSTDFTIEYNYTTNPCRPEVFDQPVGATIPGGCDNTWVLAGAVADWTLVRSYRIRLNNDGSLPSPSIANAVPAGSELRFGVPMHILSDALPAGFDTDDALSHEIAWNSFSHVGSYDKDGGAPVIIEDLLASEPRKVGITVPERMSVGNRIWRDADNSGTINAPDDTTPGIANVLVNLYRDTNGDDIPDGPAIASTTTDTEGYYLFSNIPYDSGNMNNNRYIIGIPASNFDNIGDPLYQLRSSTGTPATATYTAPSSNTVDRADDGINPATLGQEVLSWAFTLQPGSEPTAEADLSNNNRDGLPGQRRGVNGERDNNSDLTLDFGFFGGSDVPFSIGNHVWKDNGQGGGVINDGIRQAGEPPVVGALVRIYRDGNANGIPEAAEMIRTDITDADGFYLFDNLDPGPYYVEIAASNFQTGGPLVGWYSSQVTGSENVGVPLNTNTPNMDSDDNGIDATFPEFTGVFSGSIMLTRGTNEQTGETHLSSDTGSNPGFNPTEDDGPGSIGRFGEIDTTSNVTVDFGFIPPMSLGNRVWIDEGAGTIPFRTGYNNGLQDGTEVGVNGVTVQLWRDTNGTPGLQIATDTLMYFTTTDATGYYLFERLQPGSNYFVHIPAANFTGGGPLVNYLSSTDANQTTPPADNTEDTDDNGLDDAAPGTNGISSTVIDMAYNGEPLTSPTLGFTETDINISGSYGPNNVGNYGQEDNDSNLTIDFGFVRPPRSIGNRLWIDTNNNGAIDGGETPVPTGVRVSLYLDANNNGAPDDFNGDTILDGSDALAFDLTDANGYYLFDKLPPGRYIVGVDYTNFAVAGLLEGYTSSSGLPPVATYTNPPITNPDSADHGINRLQMGNPAVSPYGILSASLNLTGNGGQPTGETGSGDTSTAAGFNPTAGDGPNSRGRFGETDNRSNLSIDFGFFIPMSLGNRVFIDDGAGGGIHNNGIMDGAELPRANVRVELYRDADTDGVPDAGLVNFDTTDAGGFYLFDNLAAGSYVVVIPSSNFTGVGPLVGYNTSTPTGTENVGVPLNPYTPNTDRDDNGLNVGTAPSTGGVRSGTITLALTTEAAGETELSGQADPGPATNMNFSPTGWDGPLSRGRWEERDNNSNLTIDFGFIPVYALGNRIWFDTNNNSAITGGEIGIDNVKVQLFDSTGTTEFITGADGILYSADDTFGPDGIFGNADDGTGGMLTTGGGYYRFDNLPTGDYIVRIPASNFGVGQPLQGTWSSATTISNAGAISETAAPDADATVTDSDDNGTLTSGNVDSLPVTLGPLSAPPEPTGETDLSGGQGQPDAQANMTVDFGFYRITLGNQVWGDVNNNGLLDGGELGINGVTVQLWSQDLSVMLATTTTAPVGPNAGVYTFSGLVQGNYVVRLPNANFNSGAVLEDYRSSTGAVPPSTYEPAPNPDAITTDSDDNGTETGGILGTGGYIQTSAFALTPAGEQSVDNATGLTTENRVDFGVVELVALGNRVWFDMGAGAFYNNGILDAGETPVNNVTVQLFTSTGVEVPVGPDGILGTGDDALGGVQTSGGGYYRFDRLFPGTYYVQIPAAEFQAGGDLFGYVSTIGAGANETSDNNVDENGIDVATLTTTGISTQNYTLQANTEQTGEDQSNYTGLLDDNNVNFTADFGFAQLVAIGNRVWIDDGTGGGVINDGIQNGSEPGVDGVTVELYSSPSNTLVATTTTTTVLGQPGTYQFTNLNPGDYYVHIPASMFDATLPSPLQGSVSSTGNGSNETSDQNADENGIDASSLATTGISTQVFTLSVGGETTTDDETTYTGYLTDANVNFTADFGFLQKVAIGNVVWLDNGAGGGTANDGIQNGTEPGIPSVDLQLYRVGDTPGVSIPVQTTTSGANGYYMFDDLTAGDYFIFIPAAEFQTGGTLENVRSSTGNGANEITDQSGDENGIDDASAAVNGIRSTNYTLQPNSEQTGEPQPNYTGALDDDNVNFTADFGFTELVAIGNRVWFDMGAGAFYNNGILDAGETPVNNVTVQLFTSLGVEVPVGPDGILGTGDDALGGVQTSGGGYYRFDRLNPGTYYVLIPATEFQAGGDLFGYVSTLGAGANETSDNDVDENGIDVATLTTTGIRSQNYILQPNTERAGEDQSNYSGGLDDDNVNFTADFGFTDLVAIGNRLWFDDGFGGGAPNNGIQDGGEIGISNVDVELYRVGDIPGVAVPVGTTTTDANGNYQFTNLNPGDYFVHIPASEFQTGQPLFGSVSSTGNGSNETSDQDADENGIDAVSLPTNGISSTPYTLIPNSETMLDDQTSYTGYLDNNNVNFTADFGFLQKVAIGNVVWSDNGAGGGTANDGIQNGTEPGIQFVDLQLYLVGNIPGVDAPVQTTVSGANGYYVFDDLLPGDYFIFIPATEFQTGGTLENVRSSTGNGANETTDQNGDENGIDNASAATNGITSTNYTLQPNSEQTGEPQPNYTGALDDDNVNFTADFGFTELVALGNRVWFDMGAGAFYNNGILDAGETPVNNVTVQLFTSLGVEVPVGPDGILGTGDDALGGVQTSGGGYYRFDRLNPGVYYVQIPAAEFQAGGDLFGYVSSLGAGANEISDNDVDENGIDVATLTTTGIRSQDYTLLPNSERTGEDQSNYTGVLDDNNVNFTADFGFTQLVAIGNVIWFDIGNGGGTSNDGIQNGAEAGVSTVDVELYHVGDTPGVTVPVGTTTTDANGNYQFTNLNPGDYFVHIPASEFQTGQPLEDYVSTTGNGSNETSDQDVDENGIDAVSLPTNGISSTPYTLTPDAELSGEDQTSYTGYLDDDNVNFTADFGFLQKVAIGNVVWLDNGAGGGTVNDGIQNGTEPGIQFVDLQLYRVGDIPGTNTPVKTTTTGANGYYVFDDLLPGDYFIFIPAAEFQTGGTLENYSSSTGNGADETTDQAGDENGIDNASPATNGITSTNYTLQPNSEQTLEPQPNYTGALDDDNVNFTADFGFVEAYSIGNRVWFDTDNSGTINGSEVGVPGVTVELYAADALGNPTGVAIRTTTTVAGGYYLFDDLYGGDYVVVLPASNFTGAGLLTGYWSSGTTISPAGIISEVSAPDADLNVDSDDNGTLQTGGAFAGAVIAQNVVLGPTGNTEPPGETDLDSAQPGNHQGQPDARANMTVDFGFYRVELGNLVFADLDSDGAFNGSDIPYFNIQVLLYSADGTTEIPVGLDGILGTADDNVGGMFTNISGTYLFSNLPEGSYTVRTITPAGSSSTIDTFDAIDNSNPDTNTDNNDNGFGIGVGVVSSAAVDLAAGSVGAQINNTVNNSTGTTSNPTVDFGFVVTTYSLGNRVWFDTDNNSLIDSGEVGVNGVVVELYAADLAGNPIFPALATDTTTNGGYYLFDRLLAGDYIVAVDSSNFAPGGVLNSYWSSATIMDSTGTIQETGAPDPDLGPNNVPGGGDDDLDSDDNGTFQTNGTFSGAVLSLPVTIGPGNIEPVGETDLETGVGQGTSPDLRGNMTVDFGFYRVELGNLVFVDVNSNGTYDTGDAIISGATVQLFTTNGTEINVGPDGILGTSDDAPGGMLTDTSGNYTFTGLAQGDYVVTTTPVVGFTSTVDTADSTDTTNPNTNTDNNDNGIGVSIGQVTSSFVTLTPGDTGTSSNNTVRNNTGTTSNPTLDFGFVGNNGALTKRLINTSESFTTGNKVAIGEILTYEVSINLPLGTPLTSVTLTDRMDKGLAFVDCLRVEVAGVDQTGTVCPPAVSDIVDPADAATNPANPGRQVVFTIGDIPAQTTATTLVVRYRAVVLDVIENQAGGTLNNSATWAWTGGSFTTSAENVEIVEPDISIDKSANPVTDVAIGTPVQFTLTIAHTDQSTADAFDVDVSDILPSTLEYIPCTIVYSGLTPTSPTAPAYCPGKTTDLVFHWDSFPLGASATITFNAQLVGTPATNSASVVWTSLPIDPGTDGLPIELSDFNTESTERWYDPLDDVNIYAVTDSVAINSNGPGGDGNLDDEESGNALPTVLPATGFAPNRITQLPAQSEAKAYKATEVWLEIPRLGVEMPIVGVPLVDGDWDVSWLAHQAGWLNGTAFPGWLGNSVLTGHVTLPNGKAGPFSALGELKWGDRIIIHAYGSIYVYEVRQNRTISPYNTTVLQHEEDAWLTLLTCKTYNEDTGVYSNRIAVRAVLLSIREDTTVTGSGMPR